jgi:hypothetical protein
MKLHIDYINSSNPNSPPEYLRELARTENTMILRRLAENTACPPDVLVELHTHRDYEVRAHVACNSSTPPEVVSLLSADPSVDVRSFMAGNPNLPLDILSRFIMDSNSIVRDAAQKTLEGASLEWELKQSKFVMVPGTHGRLGELLVVAGILDFQQVEHYVYTCRTMRVPLGRALVQAGVVSLSTITRALRCQVKVRLGQISVKEAAATIRRHHYQSLVKVGCAPDYSDSYQNMAPNV